MPALDPAERKRLRVLFREVDDLLLAGRFAEVDARLASADPAGMGVLLATGLLAITLMAREKLAARVDFGRRVSEYLARERPGDAGALLRGLI